MSEQRKDGETRTYRLFRFVGGGAGLAIDDKPSDNSTSKRMMCILEVYHIDLIFPVIDELEKQGHTVLNKECCLSEPLAREPERDELVEALEALLGIIEAAGLQNLSNGVQLGPTVWLVKANEAVAYARVALSKYRREK